MGSWIDADVLSEHSGVDEVRRPDLGLSDDPEDAAYRTSHCLRGIQIVTCTFPAERQVVGSLHLDEEARSIFP